MASPREVLRLLTAMERDGTFAPGRLALRPGDVLDAVTVDIERLQPLVVGAARRVADVPAASRQPMVVWSEGADELAVDTGGVRFELGDGVVEVRIPVRCDQTGDEQVVVAFAVGSADRPAGLIAAVDRAPRGPTVVVDRWGSALIAFAWSVLLDTANALAGGTGADRSGDRLVAGEIVADRSGLHVTAMARHRFGG